MGIEIDITDLPEWGIAHEHHRSYGTDRADTVIRYDTRMREFGYSGYGNEGDIRVSVAKRRRAPAGWRQREGGTQVIRVFDTVQKRYGIQIRYRRYLDLPRHPYSIQVDFTSVSRVATNGAKVRKKV